jgi:hypothetical protein
LRVLLTASFVSSIGGGLTLPFLVIYLHQLRHIPLAISGLVIGGVAVLCRAGHGLVRARASRWPTWNALLGVMVEDDTISRLAFARNFQLLNLGLGIGAVIGGLVVHVRQPGTFVAVCLIDATSNLIVVAALALLPKTAFGSSGTSLAKTR